MIPAFDMRTAYSIAYQQYRTEAHIEKLKLNRQKIISNSTKQEEAEYEKAQKELQKEKDPKAKEAKTDQLKRLQATITEKSRAIEHSPEITNIDRESLNLQRAHEALSKAKQFAFQISPAQDTPINQAA